MMLFILMYVAIGILFIDDYNDLSNEKEGKDISLGVKITICLTWPLILVSTIIKVINIFKDDSKK